MDLREDKTRQAARKIPCGECWGPGHLALTVLGDISSPLGWGVVMGHTAILICCFWPFSSQKPPGSQQAEVDGPEDLHGMRQKRCLTTELGEAGELLGLSLFIGT